MGNCTSIAGERGCCEYEDIAFLSQGDGMDASVATTSSISVSLEESDVDGAQLEEPLEVKTMHQLRWWLLCHGQDTPSNVKKLALIER